MTPALDAVHRRPVRPVRSGRVHPSRRNAVRAGRFDDGVPTWMILLAMFVGGLVSLLALNTASAASEVEQRAVVAHNAESADLQQQLERDLASRQAPSALAQAATALGLVPNPNPAFLRMNSDGSVTVLGQPVPASLPPAPAVAPPAPVAKPTTAVPTTAVPTASAPTAAVPTAAAPMTAVPTVPAAVPPATAHRNAAAAATVTVTVAVPAPHPTTTGGHG